MIEQFDVVSDNWKEGKMAAFKKRVEIIKMALSKKRVIMIAIEDQAEEDMSVDIKSCNLNLNKMGDFFNAFGQYISNGDKIVTNAKNIIVDKRWA
jgi:hypothetical protein